MLEVLYRWRSCIATLGCLLAIGCGKAPSENLVQVNGRLTNAGQPLKVQRQDVGLGLIQLEFYRLDGQKQSTDPETAHLDEHGHFTVPGRTGHGIPPGKYRVAVRQWDPYPDFDRLKGRFDAEHSPIIRQVSGREEILIDVSKPEG